MRWAVLFPSSFRADLSQAKATTTRRGVKPPSADRLDVGGNTRPIGRALRAAPRAPTDCYGDITGSGGRAGCGGAWTTQQPQDLMLSGDPTTCGDPMSPCDGMGCGDPIRQRRSLGLRPPRGDPTTTHGVAGAHTTAVADEIASPHAAQYPTPSYWELRARARALDEFCAVVRPRGSHMRSESSEPLGVGRFLFRSISPLFPGCPTAFPKQAVPLVPDEAVVIFVRARAPAVDMGERGSDGLKCGDAQGMVCGTCARPLGTSARFWWLPTRQRSTSAVRVQGLAAGGVAPGGGAEDPFALVRGGGGGSVGGGGLCRGVGATTPCCCGDPASAVVVVAVGAIGLALAPAAPAPSTSMSSAKIGRNRPGICRHRSKQSVPARISTMYMHICICIYIGI